MTTRRLRFSATDRQLRTLDVTELLWAERGASSFNTSLDPRLLALGQVPDRYADVVRLAAAVYLADRTVWRPRDWQREIDLEVPVSDVSAWGAQAEALQALLSFLSGDIWQLRFVTLRLPRMPSGARPARVQGTGPVLLFSGGADSMAGAVITAAAEHAPVLASQWDTAVASGAQRAVIAKLRREWGTAPVHVRVELGRRSLQVGSETEFPKEPSSRSRSLLFIALGLAAAAVRGTRLVIAENGFASLNVPLAAERRGSLSTRTTHPAFLDGLASILSELGIDTAFANPFDPMTKGEMFKSVAEIVGDDKASDLLSTSHSCATPDANYKGFPPDSHCGVCFGCLIRRAGFIAAGIEDKTFYIEEDLRGQPTRRREYLTAHKRETYEAMRYRVDRGISIVDILGLALPPRVDEDDALALAQRGLAELASVVIP